MPGCATCCALWGLKSASGTWVGIRPSNRPSTNLSGNSPRYRRRPLHRTHYHDGPLRGALADWKVMKDAMTAGRSSPLGATIADGGVNFSLYSRTASAVELLLFDREDDAQPARVVPIDTATSHTYHYW